MAIVTILSRCFVRSPSNPHEPSSGGWHIKLALAMQGGARWDSKRVCSASGRLWPWYRSHSVTKLSLAMPRWSVDHTHRRSTLYVDVLGVLVNLSGRHSRSKRTSADAFTVLEGKQCTRWQTAGRPERHTNAGHRDETFGVAEISSTSAPAPWPNFSEKLDEVGHQSRSALTFRSTPADPPGQV